MGRSSVNEALTFGKTNESDSEGEGGLEQFLGFPGQLVSYSPGFDAFREFCKAKGAIGGRTWNDSIIWAKGNCLQRDDDELLDRRFRSVKQSVKSIVEREKSLLDEVAEEETELELVLGELSLSRKKRVKSRSKKVANAQSTRLMMGVDEGTRQASRDEIKKALPASGTTVSSEVVQGERRRVEPLGGSGEKIAEGRSVLVDNLKVVVERARLPILSRGFGSVDAKANLDKIVEEHDKLGHYLMLKGYSQEEVDAIKADTYIEEEEEEAEVLGVVDGLDGVSPQTVLDNQGDDVELPEGRSEKVELDASRVREDHALMYNQEFAEQFDRMKEVNENKEDQCVKAHFRLEKLNQVITDLTRQVEEKDSVTKKGSKDLFEATERAENLRR
ncbi:hypothetical protein GIB67_028029 [Kingdonia uniflora]|uniref:Uncharacterized protein n=1 Tax=Kingdonia uniflora TaxID=39325 RepID=A0A7J7NEP7_9MAGN|nr:hypothetical protein GIB67_028029 [Kingdonia uniflora]